MLPPNNPNILLKNYILKLRDDIKITRLSPLLRRWHIARFKSYRLGASKLGISESFYRAIISGDSAMPIWALKLFVKEDNSLLEKIYRKEINYTAREKEHILPRSITPKLAYYTGYLHGDGHIDSNEKRVSFFDKYTGQLELMNNLTESLFNVNGKLYLNKHTPTLDVGRVAINSFLSEVMCINRGRRIHNKVPNTIQTNKILLKWYLCGLFDAEGAMPLNPKKRGDTYIDIAMKDEKLIKFVKYALERVFGIESYGPYKRISDNNATDTITVETELRIRKLSEVEKFLNSIGTLHPDKIRRKGLMLNLLKNNMRP